MSGMDRLDDAALESIVHGNSICTMAHVQRMARELLAHRRASQAAPAPSDGLREAAEVAAWNDAIEAADKAAIDRQGRRAMGDGHGNSCYDIGVSDAASAIRALRRAAPTEGGA